MDNFSLWISISNRGDNENPSSSETDENIKKIFLINDKMLRIKFLCSFTVLANEHERVWVLMV